MSDIEMIDRNIRIKLSDIDYSKLKLVNRRLLYDDRHDPEFILTGASFIENRIKLSAPDVDNLKRIYKIIGIDATEEDFKSPDFNSLKLYPYSIKFQYPVEGWLFKRFSFSLIARKIK